MSSPRVPGVDGRPAPVVHAVADDRPAVVQAGLYQVELVAALRSMLVGPQVAGLRVDEQPLRVPVPVAPDLGQGAVLPDERIVVRHPAVVMEAKRDPVMVRQVLRGVRRQIAPRARHAIAHRDEEVSVAVPGEAPPVVTAARRPRHEDVLDPGEPIVLEPPPDDRGRRALGQRPRVAQVQQAVGREIRVREHVEESALPPRHHLRHARHRIGQQRPVPHDAQASGAFGDQHVAVGQPRDGPGDIEAVGHGHRAKIVIGRPQDFLGGGRARGERPPDGGASDGSADHRRLLRPRASRHAVEQGTPARIEPAAQTPAHAPPAGEGAASSGAPDCAPPGHRPPDCFWRPASYRNCSPSVPRRGTPRRAPTSRRGTQDPAGELPRRAPTSRRGTQDPAGELPEGLRRRERHAGPCRENYPKGSDVEARHAGPRRGTTEGSDVEGEARRTAPGITRRAPTSRRGTQGLADTLNSHSVRRTAP